MSWSKLDDGFHEHPKTFAMSDKAFRLYVCSITYSSRHKLKGRLKPSHVAVLNRLTGSETEHVEELESLNAFDRDGQDICIHGYSDYNPDAAEISSKRSEAGKLGAKKRWQNESENGKPMASAIGSQEIADGKPMAKGIPYPYPYPNPESPTNTLKSKTKTGANASRFSPPTPAEVEEEFVLKGFGGQNLGVRFVAHYQTAGWKVKGGNKMTDWKAAVVTWCERQKERSNGNGGMTLQESAAVELERIKRLGI